MKQIREPIPVAYIPAPRPKIEKPKKQKPKAEKKVKIVRKSNPPKPIERPPKIQAKLARQSNPRESRLTAAKGVDLPEGVRWRSPSTRKPPSQEVEKKTILRRALPSLQELLPPMELATARKSPTIGEGAIRLDSKDPNYITYLSSIKRAIDLVWEYPPLALSQGIQGKLIVEFTIMGDGNLLGARLIRPSGFSILDEEALRSVRAAAPFYPIPHWIEKNHLAIIANFEYHDNRLRYSFTPDGRDQPLPQSLGSQP